MQKMLFETKDLLNKPVRVSTLTRPTPDGWMVVLEVTGNYVVLENEPGEAVVIPWSAITSIVYDYSVARRQGWFDVPEDSEQFQAARRNLFEAERGPYLGLSEEKIDELALKADRGFRRLPSGVIDKKFAAKLRDRAVKATVGTMDPNQNLSVTTGVIDSVNYRRAVVHHDNLKSAVAARKPEPEVVPSIIGLALHAGNALATYPAHTELRAWFDTAESFRQKLTDETRRTFDLESPFVSGDVPLKSDLYDAS